MQDLDTYIILALCDTRPGRTALGYFGDSVFQLPVFVSKLVKTADYQQHDELLFFRHHPRQDLQRMNQHNQLEYLHSSM